METLGTRVIAAVNGYALGGGFELALASTLIVAAESARFGLPEVGLIPGYSGTQRLPKAIGSRAVLRIMLAVEQVDPARADELGVLSQPPVPDDDLLEVVGSLADFMAGETIVIDGGETAR